MTELRNRLWWMVFLGLFLLDAVVTIGAHSLGYGEANLVIVGLAPIVGFPAAVLSAKALSLMIVIPATHVANWWWQVGFASSGVYAAALVWNAAVILG